MKHIALIAALSALAAPAMAQTWTQQQPLTVFVPNQPVRWPEPMQLPGVPQMPPQLQPQPQPFVSCFPIGGGIVSCQ